MLRKISQSPGQSLFCSKHRCKTSVPTHVILPKMSSNNLPLGYHREIKPDQTKQCDLPQCNISSQDENWTLACLLSLFPSRCLNGSTSCTLCKDSVKQKVKELGQIAKKPLYNLHPPCMYLHPKLITVMKNQQYQQMILLLKCHV